MANEELEVRIGANIDNLIKELNKSKSELNKFSGDVDKFSNKLKAAGEKMKGIGKSMSTYITLPLVALGGASIKMASDLEESFNKVDVAFGTSSDNVRDFAKTTLNAFGIAEGSALEMSALFGDMATGMGIATGDAAELSTQLVGLAGDLSSFKNINISEVQTALSGVFTGETESLKRLGIVMTEANLKAYALSEGINSNVQAMTQAEKIQLRYNYILSVTKNAQGDFARTQDGAANQMRIFSEGVKELSANFGKLLLPFFTKIITKVNDLVKFFGSLDETTKKVILTIAGIAAVVGPLLITLGFLSATAIPALITGFGLLSGALATVTTAVIGFSAALLVNPIFLVTAAIVALGVAVVKLIQYLTDAQSAWKTFKNIFKSGLNMNKFRLLQLQDQIEYEQELKDEEIERGKISRQNAINALNDNLKVNKSIKDITTSLKEQNKTKPKVTGLSVGAAGIDETGMNEGGTLGSVVPSEGELTENEARYNAHLVRMGEALRSFNEQANALIGGSIADTFGMMGSAIGNALVEGGNVLQAVGNTILAGLGSFLSDMGGMLIKYGTLAVLKGKLDIAILTGGPVSIAAGLAAIGVGVALKAAGAALGKFANQGSGGFSGDTQSSGNVGPNAPQTSRGNFGNSGGSNSLQNVVFEIQGTKLIGVIQNTQRRNNNLGGSTLSLN